MKTSDSFCLFAVCILLLVALSGCGVKPKTLTPPGGAEKDTLSRSYPAPPLPSPRVP